MELAIACAGAGIAINIVIGCAIIADAIKESARILKG